MIAVFSLATTYRNGNHVFFAGVRFICSIVTVILQ